ncbi:MaoC family dehydratase [Colwellia demingiae]|uniref:MaoC family dehydratase n=1 Tax=Colwellia demingiae TaxID=89401 RepID=A0A5C6QHF3_9GAMM|nr:MaoC family dehydratase [Colwellia demingiae]TWX68087.1 MaoC family dehydratase [Colwellia demingiae]
MKTLARSEIQSIVGKPLESTDWFTVTQKQINQFSDCTLDHQFIHVDVEKAQKTPFGSTITHGFLSLSMLSYFAESFAVTVDTIIMSINYGFDKVRFINPVKVNSRIRCHAKTIEIIEKKPGQLIFKTEVTIEIEGEDKPALTALWLSMQIVK